MQKENTIKNRPKIELKNVSYIAPNGNKILNSISFSVDDLSVAIIGKNGSGKSTLLRLIVGEITPTEGSVKVSGRIGYLPQEIIRPQNLLVSDILGVTDVLRDLDAVDLGNVSPEVLERLDGKWDMRDRSKNLLSRIGLGRLSLTTPIAALSGGELVRIAFCGLILKDPEILVLDEPTNNLDHESRIKLLEFISSWKGIKIVATHDRELLSIFSEIAEIYEGKATLYRMKYEEYVVYRKNMNNAAILKVMESKKQILKARKMLGIVLDRRNHHTASAERRAKKDLGVHRLNLSSAKSKGEATTTKLREIHLRKIENAKKELLLAKNMVRPENRIKIDIPQKLVPQGKRIVEFKDVNVLYEKKLLWKKPLSFSLFGRDKMSIIGPNGSGKTTIMRLLCGKLQPACGKVTISAESIFYIDQFLEYLDADKDILENVWQSNSNITESMIRTILARLFFRGDSIYKKVRSLSGGEKMRVALAKLFCAPKPAQLLLLDEPTNNLDIDSCEQLESALEGFMGAIIVVSHDYKFLSAIGANDCIDLTPYSG